MKFNLLTLASTLLVSASVATSQSSGPDWYKYLPDCAIDFATSQSSGPDWYKYLPDCAIDCAFTSARQIGCAIEDTRCICKNIIKFEQIFEKCILSNPKCTNVDIIVTEKVIRSLCFNCTEIGQPTFTTYPTATIRV
ncbi:hypothetical protein CVT24_012166 [Panaeolus cyanescens]|uniref:CFEM domain-containing protein n=1 Tax=Panaeolus cyanescens TaxID=181874 RepID=A0A409YIX0_9AGAR|nr:hypothetical protein CVT24_012166 [Panaeolus cyanescens]